jgi:hypothetical protein
MLLGDAFKRNPLLFAVIWVCAPISACLFWVPLEVPDDKVIQRLHTWRAVMMTAVVVISFFFGSLSSIEFWGALDMDEDCLIYVGVFAVPMLTSLSSG